MEEAPLGLTTDGRGLFVEDHALAALRQLKARNPSMNTIFYHDSGRMWTNDQPDASQCPSNAKRVALKKATFWNPTVYRADDAIVREHPEWLLRNSSGHYAWDTYQNNHVYDHSQPAMQARWAEICLNATLSGAADGW